LYSIVKMGLYLFPLKNVILFQLNISYLIDVIGNLSDGVFFLVLIIVIYLVAKYINRINKKVICTCAGQGRSLGGV